MAVSQRRHSIGYTRRAVRTDVRRFESLATVHVSYTVADGQRQDETASAGPSVTRQLGTTKHFFATLAIGSNRVAATVQRHRACEPLHVCSHCASGVQLTVGADFTAMDDSSGHGGNMLAPDHVTTAADVLEVSQSSLCRTCNHERGYLTCVHHCVDVEPRRTVMFMPTCHPVTVPRRTVHEQDESVQSADATAACARLMLCDVSVRVTGDSVLAPGARPTEHNSAWRRDTPAVAATPALHHTHPEQPSERHAKVSPWGLPRPCATLPSRSHLATRVLLCAPETPCWGSSTFHDLPGRWCRYLPRPCHRALHC